MIASMFKNKTWMFGILFFIILIVLSFFSTDNSPKEYAPYLVESPSPTGTKALYTYLEQSGQPIAQADILPQKVNDSETRLLLNPPVFSDLEVNNHYSQYVENGNHLIIGKKNPDGLFDIETEYVPETMIKEEETTDIMISSESYQVFLETPFRLIEQEGDIVLLEDEYGVIALERAAGAGSYTVFLEPDWLTNEYITKHDHLPVLFRLFPFEEAAPIIFDEYSVATRGGVASSFELYPGWAYVVLVEGLVITILLLWHQGKRFGPVQPVREETARFSDERIKAIANWQLKGKNYKESLQSQLSYLQDIIRERYGIPYHLSWKDRMDKIKVRLTSLSEGDWKKMNEGIETTLEKQSINKQEYLHWSKLIDKIRKEVESG